jgi:hypothetical protein
MSRALELIEQSIATKREATIVDPVPRVLAELRHYALGMGGSVETFEANAEVRRVYKDNARAWVVEAVTVKTKRGKR